MDAHRGLMGCCLGPPDHTAWFNTSELKWRHLCSGVTIWKLISLQEQSSAAKIHVWCLRGPQRHIWCLCIIHEFHLWCFRSLMCCKKPVACLMQKRILPYTLIVPRKSFKLMPCHSCQVNKHTCVKWRFSQDTTFQLLTISPKEQLLLRGNIK